MEAIVDDLLSLSAKGLLAMLKTKWPVEPVDIVDIPLSGIDSPRDLDAAIIELEAFGYIQWDREKDTVQLREDPDAAGRPITGYEGTKEWVIDEHKVSIGKRTVFNGIVAIAIATGIAVLLIIKDLALPHPAMEWIGWSLYGIVAVCAIVGLALVFTGRRKINHAKYELEIPPMPVDWHQRENQ